MLLSTFDYDLPPELIAQVPLPERDASRMLVVDRGSGRWFDSVFRNLGAELPAGALLVLNDVSVFPARLTGRLEGGGKQVEVLLLRRTDDRSWEALVRPAKSIRAGCRLVFEKGEFAAEVVEESAEGRRRLRFEPGEPELSSLFERYGRTPLPPYIKRPEGTLSADDRERYQTVFASETGAIAAPTAGLHFTPATLDRLGERGFQIEMITHYVGYGTFQPIRCTSIEDHRMERERYRIGEGASAGVNRAKREARPVYAVGTTVVRALESAGRDGGAIVAGAGETDLFIHPPYRFRVVDGLLTNFHLPQSTLLLLTCAFAGQDLVLGAYRHAVNERYRFFSFGDCMLIR
ncbi:MAG: tRNA preQ1(34) S-adenosylmethionine ribosyltransferase-isomerase QueA [Acidobacteria bacterium]|nr:tRNA preQ1(34) S-adenosylmethionine ribosyltransferase-isomerase QueA [Acidobacteriota bacterium]